MKAITYSAYGGAENLQLADVPVPEPGPGQVRVRVAAASLNAYDWHQYRGEPWLVRASMGWSVKEPRVLGSDLAGVIDAVGPDVTDFGVGDRVLGSIGLGAAAEYAVSRSTSFARLPDGVAWDLAAATPMAGFTALQALRDSAKLVEGERVLVWGASGGVGHLAVQLARILGAASVDAVCSGPNAELVRAMGANEVFDYTQDERPTGPYDVVIDTVCTAPLRRLKPVLSEAGRVATLGGIANGRLLGPGRPMMGRVIRSRFVGVHHAMVSAHTDAQDLEWLAARLADGSLTPVVARTFALADAAKACELLEGGHVAGKLVVSVA